MVLVKITAPKDKNIEALLYNGKQDIRVPAGRTVEMDLTGDAIGYVEALGAKTAYKGKNDPPPEGSHAWHDLQHRKATQPNMEE